MKALADFEDSCGRSTVSVSCLYSLSPVVQLTQLFFWGDRIPEHPI
jgi:hypothetical protein